jgi:hypothetical protein
MKPDALTALLLDRKLGLLATRVGGLIIAMADADGRFSASIGALTRLLELQRTSARGVRHATKLLVERGHLAVEHRGAGRAPTRYRVAPWGQAMDPRPIPPAFRPAVYGRDYWVADLSTLTPWTPADDDDDDDDNGGRG